METTVVSINELDSTLSTLTTTSNITIGLADIGKTNVDSYVTYGTWTYYPYTILSSNTTNSAQTTIEKVENGFFVTKDYKKYVAKNNGDLTKLIIKLMEENKK